MGKKVWGLLGCLVICFALGWGLIPHAPKVVAIRKGQHCTKFGKINLFEEISDALYNCNSDHLRFLKVGADVPAVDIYRINCLCDGVIVEDWRLLSALRERGIRVPIFLYEGEFPTIQKVVYGMHNELFGHQLVTSSPRLVEQCLKIWGEQIMGDDLEAVMTRNYREGIWGVNEQGEGYSGPGDLPENTCEYRAFLEEFLKKNQIQSVVEIGCGDWTLGRHIDWGDVDYTGVDWIGYILERNRVNFGSEKVRFIHGNALDMPLPKADLVICKEVFQHLSNRDTQKLLKQCLRYKHCLLIDDFDPQARSLADIPSGSYLPTSLLDPPFSIDGQKVLRYGGGRKVVVYTQKESK